MQSVWCGDLMNRSPLPTRELTYRGIEAVDSPDELANIFECIIQAVPDHVTIERIVEELMVAHARHTMDV